MKLVWKILLVFTVGLITYDTYQDARNAHASDPPGTTACHSCSCGPHLATEVRVFPSIVLRPQPFAPYEPLHFISLLPKPIFHPPKASV